MGKHSRYDVLRSLHAQLQSAVDRARAKLADGMTGVAYLALIRDHAAIDPFGEFDADAADLLTHCDLSADRRVIERSLTDLRGTLDRLIQFEPDRRTLRTESSHYPDQRLYPASDADRDELDRIRAQGNGRFDRLRGLAVAIVATGDGIRVASQEVEPVELRGDAEIPLVLGQPAARALSSREYPVVTALVRRWHERVPGAAPKPLVGKGLESTLPEGSAAKTLDHLMKTFPDSWGRVIRSPKGVKGAGWGLMLPSAEL